MDWVYIPIDPHLGPNCINYFSTGPVRSESAWFLSVSRHLTILQFLASQGVRPVH